MGKKQTSKIETASVEIGATVDGERLEISVDLTTKFFEFHGALGAAKIDAVIDRERFSGGDPEMLNAIIKTVQELFVRHQACTWAPAVPLRKGQKIKINGQEARVGRTGTSKSRKRK